MADYSVPEDWDAVEHLLFDALIGGDDRIGDDDHLQALFDAAMFDTDRTSTERDAIYDELVSYLWDEYQIDFEEVFDWEDYREWYDSA